MPIIRDCELFFIKCDPKRPDSKFDKNKPKWVIQVRTSIKEKKAEFEAIGVKMTLKMDENKPESKPWWQGNISRRAKTKDGGDNSPVEITSGAMVPIDPNTIANGSVGHIRVYVRDWKDDAGASRKTPTLQAIQIIKHKVYVPKPRDEFAAEDTETIPPETTHEDGDAGDDDIPY